MKKTILSILLLSLSIFVTAQCSKASVNSSEPHDSAQDKQQSTAEDYSAPPNAPFTAEEVSAAIDARNSVWGQRYSSPTPLSMIPRAIVTNQRPGMAYAMT